MNYEIGKTCLKRQFSNDFVKNFKEFVEAGTPYRFSTTHPFA